MRLLVLSLHSLYPHKHMQVYTETVSQDRLEGDTQR